MSEISSDILERQFGPTILEILRHEDLTRVITTKTADVGQVLELSWVNFERFGVAKFAAVHEAVQAGESMGKAFRSRGVAFKRQTQAVYSYELPDRLARRFAAPGPATVVAVSVLAGPDDRPYADILEIYSPAVSWPEPGRPASKDIAKRVNAFDQLLTDLLN